MAKKKRHIEMSIRRRSRTQAAPQVVSEPVPEQGYDAEDDNGVGFVQKNNTDFLGNEAYADFIPDDELEVSEEIFAEFQESFGAKTAEQNKAVVEALAKMQNTVDKL